MTSDEKRRRIAKMLRDATEGHGDVPGIPDSEVFCILEIGTGFADGFADKTDVEALADLIDRPTCELVEVWDDETKQHYLDCTACHFGRLAIELDDEGKRFNSRALWASVDHTALTHCPYCGADVVR